MRYFYIVLYIFLGLLIIGLSVSSDCITSYYFNLDNELRLRLFNYLFFGGGIVSILQALIWTVFPVTWHNKELDRQLNQKSNATGYIATLIFIGVVIIFPLKHIENLFVPGLVVVLSFSRIAYLYFAWRHYLANKENA